MSDQPSIARELCNECLKFELTKSRPLPSPNVSVDQRRLVLLQELIQRYPSIAHLEKLMLHINHPDYKIDRSFDTSKCITLREDRKFGQTGSWFLAVCACLNGLPKDLHKRLHAALHVNRWVLCSQLTCRHLSSGSIFKHNLY